MDSTSDLQTCQELYFLIAKFLEDGPCQKTLEIFKQELTENKILPKRIDWEGEEHEQTFDEYERKNFHIGSSHLYNICRRLGVFLDKDIKPSISGIKSLLGAGRQSLLRTKDVKKCMPLVGFVARRHGCPIYSPPYCSQHNIVQVLYGRETSGPLCRRHAITPKLYARTHLLNRTLGHLSAVYCLLFDRTGRYILTGADDLLVKIWSAIDGRLLSTFRGASAEITDITINVENTLLAAGSLDRIIRVWCLQSGFPVATLASHTGTITGVNFCPNPVNDLYYLVSTSSDGSVAFWSYNTFSDGHAIFDPKPLQYHEKMRPGVAQMLCAKFSVGGLFLAAGSADHHVRVYAMFGDTPHRIMEIEKHTDRVDSIQWANKSLKFISGSKDGTAIIWHYRAQRWISKQLFMSTNLDGHKPTEEESRIKLKVTMVSWSADDVFVITAVNDYSLKVWSSISGELLKVLKGHKEEVYVLENHPYDSILLSAAHDGVIILWNLVNGENLTTYQNHIEGQGNGAVFDAKWSPDGTMIAATDSHGHLLTFGLSPISNKFKDLPKELFFHTDYRPLVRDALNNVLDEQTQVPPHLMPPPFLVDIDGNPYPPKLQRLVPGREHCSVDQLIPNIIFNAGGQQEVIQNVSETVSNIDQMIEELAGLAGNANRAPPVVYDGMFGGIGLRLRGDIEGVRQSSGNWQRDGMDWKRGDLIPPLGTWTLRTVRGKISQFAEMELEDYRRESRRVEEVIPEIPAVPVNKKNHRRNMHSYRTRAAREQQMEEDEADDGHVSSAGSDTSDVTAHSEDMLNSSSSTESSSTEYSDWVADHGVSLEPPQRSRRKRKRPPPPPVPVPPPPKPRKAPVPSTSAGPSTSTAIPGPSTSQIPQTPVEVPELYRPSEWLSEVIPKKFPYYPQMGDEVMFFAQGYNEYIKAVREKSLYTIAESQYKPWGKLVLKEPETVKIIGIKYELRPPRLCCLRLAVIKHNGRISSDCRFTIKYHDIPDVIDFFVLKQTYDTAMERQWKPGDRFRSMIDDGWWWGTIESNLPDATSAFLCHRIKWDNGESEGMSPWDMELVDGAQEPETYGGSIPVHPDELSAILYHPNPDEWPDGDRDAACANVVTNLEEVMGLSIAEPFIAPVDINMYPRYSYVVEFPIDLSTIKARFENKFYRRVTAAQFDIRYLATNAEKFNGPHSIIVKHARIITDLCLKICKNDVNIDVPHMYRHLMESYQSSGSESDELNVPSTSTRERAAASRSLRAMRRANNHQQPDWRRDCRQLLDVLWNCHDSEPFKTPVDRLEHPDYDKIIDTPMDLGTIREELRGGNYESPLEFCKDVRMIFSNSRTFNTNKRSKIYVMTVRLSAMAEEHMKRIAQNWKNANSRESRMKYRSNMRRTKRKATRYTNENSSSGDESDYPSPKRTGNLVMKIKVNEDRSDRRRGESSMTNGAAYTRSSAKILSDDDEDDDDQEQEENENVENQDDDEEEEEDDEDDDSSKGASPNKRVQKLVIQKPTRAVNGTANGTDLGRRTASIKTVNYKDSDSDSDSSKDSDQNTGSSSSSSSKSSSDVMLKNCKRRVHSNYNTRSKNEMPSSSDSKIRRNLGRRTASIKTANYKDNSESDSNVLKNRKKPARRSPKKTNYDDSETDEDKLPSRPRRAVKKRRVSEDSEDDKDSGSKDSDQNSGSSSSSSSKSSSDVIKNCNRRVHSKYNTRSKNEMPSSSDSKIRRNLGRKTALIKTVNYKDDSESDSDQNSEILSSSSSKSLSDVIKICKRRVYSKYNTRSKSEMPSSSVSKIRRNLGRKTALIKTVNYKDDSESDSDSSKDSDQNLEIVSSSSSKSSSDVIKTYTINGHVKVLRPVNKKTNGQEESEKEESDEEESSDEEENEPQVVNKSVELDEEIDDPELNSVKGDSPESEESGSNYFEESISEESSGEMFDVKTVKPSTRTRKRAHSESDDSDNSWKATKSRKKPARPRRSTKKTNYADSETDDDEVPSRPRRAVKKRRVSEDSEDSEENEDSEETPQISISSRGRVRKISARARAFLKD